jgi:hypothetical protein
MQYQTGNRKAHLLQVLILVFLSSLSVSILPAFAAAGDCTLENEYLTREIVSGGAGVHTTSFTNKLTGKKFEFQSDEFRIVLDNGARALTAKDFRVADFKSGDGSCEYKLAEEVSGITATLTFTLKKDEFWTGKQLDVEAGGHLVNEIEVERFNPGRAEVERFDTPHDGTPPWNWPGGRPVFIGRQLFAGLEYPAGWNEEENGIIKLHQYPGRRGSVRSKRAVIGVAADTVNRRVEDAFAEYLDRIRAHPPRRFILWNAYFNKYDMGGGASEWYSDASVKKKFLTAKKMFADTGTPLAAVLVDGGWADPKSLMEEDRRAPNRLKLVRSLARKYFNCPIGVHVITHGIRGTIDKQWLKSNFDMIDDKAYCFADPRAADLEIKNLRDLQQRLGLVAFKFDWGNFVCNQENHRGHLPGERYAREAITDNQIRMLEALHAANPDVFLYNTGWYSPWWLMYYDAVFAGEDDYNNGLAGPPSFYFNDIQETWRDAVIRRNIYEPRSQFPSGSLMNHSPISYNWVHDSYRGEPQPPDSFANSILMNYLRGNGLIEVYLNLANLTPAERTLWGQITKWATTNDGILLPGAKYLGGNPFGGEVYGYAHFDSRNVGIIGLRNPDIVAKSFLFTLDENIGFLDDGKTHAVRIAYPYEASLGDGFKYGDTVGTPEIERAGVVVLEIDASGGSARPQSARSAPEEKPFAEKVSLKQTDGAVKGEYKFKTVSERRTRLVVLARTKSYKDEKSVKFEASLNGAPAAARRTENFTGMDEAPKSWEPSDGWTLFEIVLPEGDSDVFFSLTTPGGTANAWLMSDGIMDDSLPTFGSGLPAAWEDSSKVEWKLF